MRDFKKYDIWEVSHNLVLQVYELTSRFPVSEKYQLISQMQRAAYSIPSNFAEGCGRESDKDCNRFIQISPGSAHELECFFILAKDLSFINETKFEDLNTKSNELKESFLD